METENKWLHRLIMASMIGFLIVFVMQGIGPDKIINVVASWF